MFSGFVFILIYFRFNCCITFYIVIVITVLVTTFYAISIYYVQSMACASKWLIERNSWCVAKKVKVCTSIYLNCQFVQHAHAHMHNGIETKAPRRREKTGTKDIYIIRDLCMRIHIISRYSIIIAWIRYCNPSWWKQQRAQKQSQTKADSGTFTSNHLLLHSFDFDGFVLLLI